MSLLIWAGMFMIACGCIADEKGRCVEAWAISGFFFTIVALFIIICLPDKNE